MGLILYKVTPALSVPGSRRFFASAAQRRSDAAAAAPWDPDAVLSSMRNRRGEPNLRVRLLAVLVALLLLGPAIALAVFKLVAGMLHLMV